MKSSKKPSVVVDALLTDGYGMLRSDGCNDEDTPDFYRVYEVWTSIGMKQLTLSYDWTKDNYYFFTRGHKKELRDAMPKRLTLWDEYDVKEFVYTQRPYFDHALAAAKALKRKPFYAVEGDDFDVLCSQPSFDAEEFSGLISGMVDDGIRFYYFFFNKEKRFYACGLYEKVAQYLVSKGVPYEKDEDDLVTFLEGEEYIF